MSLVYQNPIIVSALIAGLSILTFYYRKDIAKLFDCSTDLNGRVCCLKYEIFGQVPANGLGILEAAKEYAIEIGVRGLIMTTMIGSIKGNIQGPLNETIKMKNWLENICNTNSKLERIEFSKIEAIHDYYADEFMIVESEK